MFSRKKKVKFLNLEKKNEVLESFQENKKIEILESFREEKSEILEYFQAKKR